MSSKRNNNANSKYSTQEQLVKTNKTDTANKENVMADLGAHLAVHAERMKLLKRAEEGLGKSLDPLAPRISDHDDGKSKVAPTQVMEANQDKVPTKQDSKKSKLPVSAARQRRRDKQDGYQIQIKNYKPGYTWNRGGRVKELKIRCLARKFLHIWKRKVFGRVMPSIARNHFHTHIMKLAFKEWYDMWWYVRKEWRLMVRAECHFRYLAWTKYFEAWKEFIHNRREDKRKMAIAIKYDTQHVLRTAMKIWKSACLSHKQKSKKKTEATEHYQKNLQKRCWIIWKDRYDLRMHRKNMDVISLQFWAYHLQVQHWLLWCDAYKRRQTLHNKGKLAIRHHKFYTMQKTLTAWITFTTMKKEKKAEKEHATSLYHRSVLVRSMRVWVNHYNRRMVIHNHQAHIEELAQRFTKRRYIQRWLYYIDMQHRKQENQELAVEHYGRKLMRDGFSAFKLYLDQQRMKVKQTVMADNYYITMLTRRHFNHWLARCENNEELAIHHLTVKANTHYRNVICRKLLDAWMDYMEWRKHRQAQYEKADAYYYVRAMPVFLAHIKAHAELQKRTRQYAGMAVVFRRENLSARFFFMWYNNFVQSREDRMNERMAILHHEGCIFKSFFSAWRRKYSEALEDERKQEQAIEHFNHTLCKKYLGALKQYMEDLKTEELNDVKATKHNYLHKISTFMRVWKQHTSYKKQKRIKENKADDFYKHLVYKRVMKKMKSNLIQGRQFKQIAEQQYKVNCEKLLRCTLLRWKSNCSEQRMETKAEQTAVCYYHRCLLGKVVTAWHRYSVIHAYKKSETRKWVENTQKVLHHNKLQRYFLFWKKARDESLLHRLKNEQATQHYNRVLLVNLITQWKQFVQISIRKKLLMKQSDWFNGVRLKTWTLTVWKQEHAKNQETERKSALALWHWSLMLQRQALLAWYIYTQDRIRKKSRIDKALERRRTRLVRNGITQFLNVTNDLSALRAKFAAQQHATKAFALHQLVQKCALHWRQWAASHKLQHPSQPEKLVKQRVDVMHRPVPCIPATVMKQVNQKVPVIEENPQLLLPKNVIPENLVPLTSASPAKSKGLIPVGLPSKNVDFKLDRNVPTRRKPRHPSFLAESLKRAGLFSEEEQYMKSDSSRTPNYVEHSSGDGPTPCFEQSSNDTTTNLKKTPSSVPNYFQSSTHDETKIIPFTREESTEGKERDVHVDDSDTTNNQLLALLRSDQTTVEIPSANSGQTSGGIGSTSTLQVRGLYEKISTEDKTQSDSEDVKENVEKLIFSEDNLDKKFTAPKQGYKTFETKLLTPADFTRTQMTSTLTKDVVLPRVGLSPREREKTDEFSSINSTMKTKESVDFLSTGNSSTKFKETSGFVKSENDTTPGSADSMMPINIESPREGKRGTSLANQITDIRNRLQAFNTKKKKLRKLQKQHVHLSDWLQQEQKNVDDDETAVIMEEVNEIEEEMKKLNQEIDIEKPMCAKLVSEVQILVKLLQGSSAS